MIKFTAMNEDGMPRGFIYLMKDQVVGILPEEKGFPTENGSKIRLPDQTTVSVMESEEEAFELWSQDLHAAPLPRDMIQCETCCQEKVEPQRCKGHPSLSWSDRLASPCPEYSKAPE